jgi:8-oxoguanine deaminase
MDPALGQIQDGGIFVTDNVIQQVGPTAVLPETADTVIEAHNQVVLPGFINTHHHVSQSLTRAYPSAQNAAVGAWLQILTRLWDRITPDALYLASLVGFAELLLSGCTTTADHLYYLPPPCSPADEIAAAHEIGLRLHLCVGHSPPPASQHLPVDHAQVLRLGQESVEKFHDPAPCAMIRVGLTGSLVYDPTEFQRDIAQLAQATRTQLHGHLAETADQAKACVARFGHRLVEHAEVIGWLGSNVWYAHGVHLDEAEIVLLAATGTGICHCPSSNMRLGSGIAPVVNLLRAGVCVGVGVDGSASNDSSHMLGELRQALLLQRVGHGPEAITVGDIARIGTVNGAQLLGRDELGRLAPGLAADLVGFDLNVLDLAGAWHDPLAGLLLCTPQKVAWSIVNGKVRVWGGSIVGLDMERLLQRHRVACQALLETVA